MRRLAALIIAMLLLAAGPAMALESASTASPRMTASLISETDAIQPGQPFRVALRLQMARGWHTYWRNPGDAGIPPELHFTLPSGVSAGETVWPAPSAHAEGPLMTYGYDGQALLPVTIFGASGATAVQLHANWLVCDNICVPEEGDFRLDLPVGPVAPSPQAGLFAAADARTPVSSPWLAQIAPDGTLALTGQGLSAAAVQSARFFPDGSGSIVDSAPQKLSIGADHLAIALKPGPDFRPGAPLGGVVVLTDEAGQQRALTISAAPVAATTGFWEIVGLAFAGGLILNLMPCVFPILAMKAVGLAGLVGRRRGHAWGHAVAYTIGVLATFSLLGFVLLALRQAGAASGWGFQFQSPTFVAAMALLLFGVGLNLSGVFAVGGPVGAGQDLVGRGGLGGSFFTGLLAVLVATPCTAPFMGAAIAAGLAGSAPMTLAVFVAMGLGLASPYVLLATLPPVARAMPRPGRWMEVLKQALAFPMYAASAWMVWVLSQEAGSTGVLAAGAGLVLLGFGAWVLGLAQSSRPGVPRRTGFFAATVAAVAALATLAPLATGSASPRAEIAEPGIEPFTPSRLASLRAEGRPVFVNMTAAWCVTCLVNERVALDSPRVRDSFASHGIAYLKGDWTRQDPDITRFLRAHQRDGVPFYALFPGGGGAPTELPQILTEAGVLAAVAGLGT